VPGLTFSRLWVRCPRGERVSRGWLLGFGRARGGLEGDHPGPRLIIKRLHITRILTSGGLEDGCFEMGTHRKRPDY
jgi:hypothetical protein